ncbi:hypothetical protein CEXT_764221 [Caerostris extrusa]|uniref:Uncharacterized protein n=1 Tax=Caerostris extrusa TaxID=172846 RepID=A0AAV4X4R7_CAEEX|nr:hypothetical protein CEXT_764221 [Caerostris extrusa]
MTRRRLMPRWERAFSPSLQNVKRTFLLKRWCETQTTGLPDQRSQETVNMRLHEGCERSEKVLLRTSLQWANKDIH